MSQQHPPIIVDNRVYHWSHSQQRYVPYNDTTIDSVTAIVVILVIVLAVVIV